MAIRCTITAANVVNEYGQTLAVGTIYTPVNDDYALALISQGRATDTDDYLEERVNAPFDEVVYPVTPAGYSLDASGNVTGLAGPDGATIGLGLASDGYHFHGFAPNQINSDLKFYDYSGALNDGTFQTQLTTTVAWANAGFLTQSDPSGVGQLWLVALPAISWDYLNGDSLFIFWRGMATPEGGDSPIMGNTGGTSANGFRVMVTSAGKLKLNAYQASGALSRFGGTSTGTCFEATTAHSFALAVNGVAGTHCYWVDGVRDAGYSGGFLTFGSGGIIDTVSSANVRLGGDGSTSGSVQLGVACRTQTLASLTGRRGLGTPAVADLDLLVANLHRNPQKLVSNLSW